MQVSDLTAGVDKQYSESLPVGAPNRRLEDSCNISRRLCLNTRPAKETALRHHLYEGDAWKEQRGVGEGSIAGNRICADRVTWAVFSDLAPEWKPLIEFIRYGPGSRLKGQVPSLIVSSSFLHLG